MNSAEVPSISPVPEDDDYRWILYQHGLSLAVLFDLLVTKGILTEAEIQQHAQSLNRELVYPESDDFSR